MHDPEFRDQLIQTAPQWNSGLLCRLGLDSAGISLFARPAFEEWLTPAGWTAEVADTVIDECRQAYWLADEKRFRALFRHDPRTGLTERLIRLGRADEIEPLRLWLTPAVMWVFDARRGRALAMARENLQVLHEITIAPDFIEIAFDPRGAFYTIEQHGRLPRLCRYEVPPAKPGPICTELKACREPAAVAVASSGDIFVYCSDLRRLVRVRGGGQEQEIVGSQPIAELKNFTAAPRATPMEIDNRGVIYLASRTSVSRADQVLHQFDPAGSYLGPVKLPRDITTVIGIGFDTGSNLYLATDLGIAKFSMSLAAVGDKGDYYTRTLDSGVVDGRWHRLVLDAQIPPRTSVEVRHHASDDVALKRAVDKVLESSLPAHEKCERMERLLGPHFDSPRTDDQGRGRKAEVFQSAAQDAAENGAGEFAMLLTPNHGRYLWLRLTLTSYDERNRPSLRSLRVLYPRTTYLRYLPAVYREDPVHAAFLERFLGLFETIFHGLERRIDLLFQHFDPQLAPAEFLPWLASWINLTAEEDLPRDRVRRLIERSPLLYRRKGTPAAISEFLEIYTGRRAFVVEDGAGVEPIVLGAEITLGHHSVLLGSGVRGFRLGDTSVVGMAALRDRVSDADEPFRSLSGRFTVLIDMPPAEFAARRRTLERILEEQKPAHATCTLRLLGDRAFAGVAVLGAGATVTDWQPYRVGVTPLGGAVAGKPEPGLRLERGAWIGNQAGLA